MPKRKCTFTNELQKKFPTYSPGRDKWKTAFTVCKPGTYVSVSNGGATDLKAHIDTKKHKKAEIIFETCHNMLSNLWESEFVSLVIDI